MTTSLPSIGWDSEFEQAFSPLYARGLVPGRVSGEHRGQVDVLTATKPVRALVRGTLEPGIGDWVGVRLTEGLPPYVEAVLPRRTRFVRKAAGRTTEPQLIAANVDVVLIVTSLNSDLNLRRIERYLAAVVGGGATPVVVLTKADLVEDPSSFARTIPAEHVVALSALRGTGLDVLWPHLRGTVALVGMSGVGKSTLVNALLGEEVQDTAGIRERDDRGKHTTTRRTLLPLPRGGCLIDTPGMRELGLWEGEAALDAVYRDIASLAVHCAFRDCGHAQEPGCEVLGAIERGDLDPSRLRGYRKLQRELAGERRRQTAHQERALHRKSGRRLKKQRKIRRRVTGRDW